MDNLNYLCRGKCAWQPFDRKDTKPELRIRKMLHALGYRFRIHRADMPGKPDIVLPRYGTVLFIHGCFWHGHDCTRGRRRPATRAEYWDAKIRRNQQRDRRNVEQLERQGWKVVTVWECTWPLAKPDS